MNIKVGESERAGEEPERISWLEAYSVLDTIDNAISEFTGLEGVEPDYSGVLDVLKKYSVILDHNTHPSCVGYSIELVRNFKGLKVIEQDAETFLGDDWEEDMRLGEDMPNLTVYMIVEIDSGREREFLNFISALAAVYEGLEDAHNSDFVAESEKRREKIEAKETERRERDNRGRRELDREEKTESRKQVRSRRKAITEFMEDVKGLNAIGPYLIDARTKEIYVIIQNLFYQNKRQSNEELLTNHLKAEYTVHEIIETFPKGTGYIPIFAAQMRKKVMGWGQSTSIFTGDDELLVNRAEKIRIEYLESVLPRLC